MLGHQERFAGGVSLLCSQLFDFWGSSHATMRCSPPHLILITCRLPASRRYEDVLSVTQSDRSRLGLNADETENVPRGLAPAQVEKAQSPGSSGLGGADMLDGTCDVKLLFF